jgi:DNA-binding response OmpR family regulator
MQRFSSNSADRRRRILVVDDDEDARGDFVATLRMAGYEVAEAWGAAQAMRLLLSYRPDAVLLDLVLPDGHGIEIGRATRAIVTTARTCVVAVTGSASSVALVDPASFGAETILVKPVEPRTLLSAVERCFGGAPTDSAVPLPTPSPVRVAPDSA